MKLSSYSIKPRCCSLCILCIIAGAVLAIVISLLIMPLLCKSKCVDPADRGLCVSLPAHVNEPNAPIAELDIPPNAAITKIVVTIVQDAATPFNVGAIQLVNENNLLPPFETYFTKDIDDLLVTHEVDFIHPLCVGPDGATVSLLALNNLDSVAARNLIINVLYCPKECIDDNGGG